MSPLLLGHLHHIGDLYEPTTVKRWCNAHRLTRGVVLVIVGMYIGVGEPGDVTVIGVHIVALAVHIIALQISWRANSEVHAIANEVVDGVIRGGNGSGSRGVDETIGGSEVMGVQSHS
ncbi:hypothetical protein DFH07DRAFT_776473 [Mycena maculata]|uniref:Uncharacterized protein n=1 Tax=Mycena maculata TaxID=230809 RepID=A0AAD7ILX6_9AGAR|nr:hypothetical protein DFH07DRAFT_776473 [Mycena maculata]